MAQVLKQMFEEAAKISLNAKMRLVMLVSTTSSQAEAMPDSPEAVERFRQAMARVRQELGK